MSTALVPVRELGAGKSRLHDVFNAKARAALTLAMLGDALQALQNVPQIKRIAVVTPDETIAAHARNCGAEALLLQGPGLNPSLNAAQALLACADSLLVLLGDVAGAAAAELARLYEALAAQGGRGGVLAAARDGGTAALLRAPADAFPNCFGPQSARKHAAAARAAGVPFCELALPSLATDLDCRDDIAALLAGPGPAPRTRALLAQLQPELQT